MDITIGSGAKGIGCVGAQRVKQMHKIVRMA
jgi:hypothetical protein